MLELFAYAKINLTLDVLGLRADGYHDVEMVMQSLALGDRLTLEERGGEIMLSCDFPGAPRDGDNIIYRAARLLREQTGCRRGVFIRLEKNIPVAAGLGGGSADAAAALFGLNMLWNLDLTPEELLALGERLGADVPFCLTGGTVLARGIGERLEDLPPAPSLGVLLVKPHFGVSTAGIYSLYDTMPVDARPDTAAMVRSVREGDSQGIFSGLCNVLEPVTSSLYPVLTQIKRKLLKAGAGGALMSGSGPTVYGLFADEAGAREAARRLDVQDCRVLVTSTGSGKISHTCRYMQQGVK